MIASEAGDTTRLQRLVEGCTAEHVNAPNAELRTALHYAAGAGHVSTTRLLVLSKATVGAKDNKGRTPLHLACCAGCTDAASALIEAAAEVDARDAESETSLHMASRAGHAAVVVALLPSKADVTITTPRGARAIIEARAIDPPPPPSACWF